MRLNHGVLHLVELGWYEQFGATGNAEEDTDQDAYGCDRHPFVGAERGKRALDRLLHVLTLSQSGATRFAKGETPPRR